MTKVLQTSYVHLTTPSPSHGFVQHDIELVSFWLLGSGFKTNTGAGFHETRPGFFLPEHAPGSHAQPDIMKSLRTHHQDDIFDAALPASLS